jgi:alkyl hydroperoxide reductase subunit AhpC
MFNVYHIEIIAFSEKAEEFRKTLNTEIIAISTDSQVKGRF